MSVDMTVMFGVTGLDIGLRLRDSVMVQNERLLV
jgi:hypothetical protein